MNRAVLVTGAGGMLGRRVAAALRERGLEVHAGSPDPVAPEDGIIPVHLDLTDDASVSAAVSGIGAVVHCATDHRRHRDVDILGTRRLVAAAPDAHIVYPGIVGSDIVPLRYYRSKIEAERIVAGGGAWTIIRATQFHQTVWDILQLLARGPVVLVPKDTRVQVLDPMSLARRLAAAVVDGPGRRLPDVGGRFAYEAKDLARSYLAAVGSSRRVVPINYPGIVGASLRAGANLTANRDETGETWNDFVERRQAAGQARRPE